MAAILYKWLNEAGSVSFWGGPKPGKAHWFLLGVLFWSFAAHPYYVSVTEVEYKPATGEIEIACKIFTDDLELALKQSFQEQVDLYNPSQKERNERLLSTYLQKHLVLTGNNRKLPLVLVGSEIQEEAYWSYLLVKQVPRLKSLTVNNDLLYHARKDQINIIHFRVKEERRSHRLTYPDDTYTFTW